MVPPNGSLGDAVLSGAAMSLVLMPGRIWALIGEVAPLPSWQLMQELSIPVKFGAAGFHSMSASVSALCRWVWASDVCLEESTTIAPLMMCN